MAYKILFFYIRKVGEYLEEIGAALKEARENIGLSIEEVASDLKVKTSQVESIEIGNKDAFKDVFALKYFIRDYAKYLGLNYEDMVDEFNEYLFDYTSKISLDDIKRAKKQIEKKEPQEDRIASPYTIERESKWHIPSYVIYFIMIVAIACAIWYIVSVFREEKPSEQPNLVAYETMNRGIVL